MGLSYGFHWSHHVVMLGELIPVGGGDPIPLLKSDLMVGRRESCDVVLRFANVSSQHCKLECHGGYWYVRDLNSKNGTRVNGVRITEKLLNPGDVLRVAKHQYRVEYSPMDLGAVGPPPADSLPGELLQKSLLERAGLSRGYEEPGAATKPSAPVGNRHELLRDDWSPQRK
jgi:adenylate cyclase